MEKANEFRVDYPYNLALFILKSRIGFKKNGKTTISGSLNNGSNGL